MANAHFYIEAPPRLRAFVRAREASLILLAVLVGAIAGLVVAAMSATTAFLHVILFDIPAGSRLSSQLSVDPLRAIIVPSVGGLILGFVFLLVARWRPEREVDPIEANALHGGRMSFRESVIVAAQTIWSSGVGASVGLEAGYTQLSSGLAASFGRGFHLRRADQRVMVGCGAAGAIAGAFGAPLAGAFYAFELVLGGYTPASLTPVGVAAVMGYVVANAFTPSSLGIFIGPTGEVLPHDLAIASVLGILAAMTGIGMMRGVSLSETLFKKRLWGPLRPLIGGLFVGMLALLSPQVLSSGHGALHLTGMMQMTLGAIATIFVLKAMASMISLGAGFRGGLFFASLLLGALGGRLFGAGLNAIMPSLQLDPNVYAIIGMSAFSASVIGGPLTMTFIALESTGNLWLTTAVLIAVIISTQLTRELFGYSFATWRFHLRGETIRSAADVGWVRDLTVGRMMRRDVATIDATMPIADLVRTFPLGSKTQVVVVDGNERYAGIVTVADAHGALGSKATTVHDLAHHRDTTLLPFLNVKEAVAAFDRAEAESLAVVDSIQNRHVVGMLTEAHTLRRYAEESERRRNEMFGEP
ncbi:MAG: chloride channel protein [Rhizobiales bacterium]|nr:chloride channel protein [Hyphomicrobiales bacterium]